MRAKITTVSGKQHIFLGNDAQNLKDMFYSIKVVTDNAWFVSHDYTVAIRLSNVESIEWLGEGK